MEYIEPDSHISVLDFISLFLNETGNSVLYIIWIQQSG